MNKEQLAYLQQDTIGKVIAKGLADVYTNKPQAPVKYLAAWLRKYSANQREIAQLALKQTLKANSLNAHNRNLQVAAKEKKEQQISKISEDKKLQDFKNKVANHDYHQQLLDQQLPEFIEKQLNLTGVYIGYLNHPPKQVTDEDEDQNAHLNTSVPKLINYIGASKSHRDLMLTKTLPLDKGVTAAALSLSLDEPAPNEEGVVEQKDKYVYIPNVVKNQSMHYFRLPKLGAYITVPLCYNSYLSEHIFDVALESRLKYLGELQDFNKAKEEDLKDLDNEKQALDQKLQELTQKNTDEATLQATKTEIAQLVKRYHERTQEKFAEQHSEIPTEKREFLVCADTLGSDRQISEQERQLLVALVKHFRDSWQSKERKLLDIDVDYQISIQKDLDRKPDAVLERLDNIVEIPAETKAELDAIQDEQIREYKKNAWQLQALKKQLKQGPEYLASFFKLKNFRVVKFTQVIQAILFFLHLSKREINLPGRTTLNWKKVRATHLYANTFSAVIDYNPEGPKHGQYAGYNKIDHILQTLQKYAEVNLFNYNVGLGGIVRLIKKQLAQRQANIELRRQHKQNLRRQRNLLLQQNERITEQKRLALQKHKATLPPEEVDSFAEEEWSSKYDEEFPLKQIPAEIVQDIDNDL